MKQALLNLIAEERKGTHQLDFPLRISVIVSKIALSFGSRLILSQNEARDFRNVWHAWLQPFEMQAVEYRTKIVVQLDAQWLGKGPRPAEQHTNLGSLVREKSGQ